MKTLFEKQKSAHDFFVNRLVVQDKNTLDSSQMGTGKTVVGCHVARTVIERSDKINRVAVICPKAVIPAWEAEMRECGLDPVFILNVEKLRTGKTPHVKRVGKKGFGWMLDKDTLVLVDEIHKCKGPWSLNANLLVGLIRQNYRVHGMSGTACETPMEMRPLGYMLGLHSNDQARDNLPSYFTWLNRLHCYKSNWGGYEMHDPKFAQVQMRQSMYGISTHGLTVADFPDSFRGNRVIVDPIGFRYQTKIANTYKKLKLSEEDVIEFVSTGRIPKSVLGDEDEDQIMLVRILNARMESEALKVPDIVEMAQDAVEEGYNVVIFLNFAESLRDCAAQLDCGYIDGSVSQDERQRLMEEFQSEETNCIVINTEAGGTGISLHDINGVRPRLSLISPSFNAKTFAQVLGRIHRNGAKSDALQKVMIAADSIEEHVMQAIATKMQSMENIHRSNICTLTSNVYK